MHPNRGHVTNLFATDPLQYLATYPVTVNLPIKTLVARQTLEHKTLMVRTDKKLINVHRTTGSALHFSW